jgi:pimeloyl-ACP methyl ester carboxylesterase
MLVHATGFHGRCWTPLARVLARSSSVWAIDQRGHGASGQSPDRRYDDWDAFAGDLLAAVDAVGGTGWRAAGHSLGGGVSLLAEARRPGTFSALCCYEPVVIPPGAFGGAGSPPRGGNPLAVLARKRRENFASRKAALENYRGKAPFSGFDPEALECYVEYGFVDRPDGHVTLACHREDEAAVFEGAMHSPTWSVLHEVRPPVAVLAGSDPSDPLSRVAEEVAKRMPRGGFRRFGHLDHFGPMTAPVEVGEVMAAALGLGEPSTIPVTGGR